MAGPQKIAQAMSQPADVADPVPNQQNPFADLAPQAAPELNVGDEQAEPMTGQMGQFRQDLRQQGAEQVQANAAMPENPFADLAEPGQLPEDIEDFSEANLTVEGLKEQFRDVGDRIKLSFAATDEERLTTAEKMFPNRKVEMRDGNLIIDGRKLDKDAVELIGDAADGARLIYEGVVENLFRAGGFISGAGEAAPAGAIAGAPAGPLGATAGGISSGLLGGVVGAAGGGATGAVVALKSADAIAEKFFEIQRDPKRNPNREAAMAAAMGAGFNLLAASSARKAASRMTERKEAVQTVDSAIEDMTRAQDAVAEVVEAGFIKEGDKFKFLPGQVVGKKGDILPELGALEKELSTEPGFRNFIMRQGQVIDNAYDAFSKQIGAINGNVNEGLGKRVIDSALDITKAEGKAIGRFRDMALKISGEVPQPVNRTVDFLQKELMELGVADLAALKKLKAEDVMGINFAMNKSQAEQYLAFLKTAGREIMQNEGAMSLKKVDAIYTGLRKQIDTIAKKSSGVDKTDLPLMEKLVPVKNALRDDWTDAIGANLGPGSKEAYQQSLSKFSGLMKQKQALGNLLSNEDISREAFVKQIFNQSKQGLPRIKALRAIVQTDNPQLWKDFVGDYFTQLRLKNTKDGVVNWQAMKKQFNALGPEFHKELFNGAPITPRQAQAMFEVGNIFSSAKFNFKAQPANQKVSGVIKNSILLLSNVFAMTRIEAGASLMKSMGGKQNALAEYLAAGGVEDVIKHLPNAKAAQVRGILSQVAEAALKGGRAATGIDPSLAGAVGAANLRGGTTELVNDLMEGTGL